MIWLWLSCRPVDKTSMDTASPHGPIVEPNGYCEEPNGLGIPTGTVSCEAERCVVEDGAFWMGSSLSPTECPIHQVDVDEFIIDQYEVTIARWQSCVTRGGCAPLPDHCRHLLEQRVDYSTQFPATCVTWTQAQSFCTQVGGRLPTEAEWEKAAAGTNAAKWAWGSQAPTCDSANFRLATIYCAQGVKPVGWYTDSMSAFGLYDVNGNVFEWTLDWYDAGFYSVSPDSNPVKVEGDCQRSLSDDPQDCTQKVLRGGAYNTTESTIRNAARSSAQPDLVDVNIGFRCVYAN